MPVGFVSDHMEVVHDLDVEAAQTAASLGLPFARAATPGTPRFAAMVAELVAERMARTGTDLARVLRPRCDTGGPGCAARCCCRACWPRAWPRAIPA